MYLISPIFSRALLFFPLISWYDYLQVPTNLGSRAAARCQNHKDKTFNLNGFAPTN